MINYLQVENLTKSYGDLVLFEDISFSIPKDSKVALIAKNGTGKTSLLNIIAAIDTADSGQVTFTNNITFGYLEQNPAVNDDLTVLEQIFNSSNEVVTAVREYEFAVNSGDEKLMELAIEKMDFHKAWDFEARIKIILTKLKITDFDKNVGILSGGQKKRLAIANLLINEPDILILDEPTNHLDVDIIEWLEEYLKKTNSTILMVTHDRYFLDRVCDEIIEIDDNSVFRYKGNYSYFLEKRDERILLHNLNVDKARNVLRKEAEWMRRMPKARTTKAKYRIENFHKLSEKAKGKIHDKNFEIDIVSRRIGKKILELKNISKSFGDLKIIEDFSYSFTNGEKIGIVGNNGTGKTTFLNLLTEELLPDSGEVQKGQTIVFGYYKQTGIKFSPDKKMIEIIRDIADNIMLGNGSLMSASQFLEYFLFPSSMHYSPVEKLSGGEQKRLYLMTVLMKNPNFLILDEPTNDFDIMTLNVLEEFLLSFNGCVIIVSHDRYFMDKVVDSLFVFEGNAKMRNFVGKYSEYFYYQKEREKEQKLSNKQDKPKNKLKEKTKSNKLSYNEKRLFEKIEKEIPVLEEEKEKLENLLSSGSLSQQEIVEKASRLTQIKDELNEKELTWLELSERL
ncbi:MAG: ABC-F family ATP-binding cassette domain-containing protein [Bacteroidota bacterium]|nr:ABC-F family ATP-binding cassette domain-containing protein [Bacteroidota bacterium]